MYKYIQRYFTYRDIYSGDTLFDTVKEVRNNDRLVLSLTYHPSITNFQNVLNEAHILLTPNKEYCKVFGDKSPMIDRRKPKSLKDHLGRTKLNVNHLEIIKVHLVVGLDVKFVLLLRKPKLFKTRIKVKHLTLEQGFWAEGPIWLFTWLSVNHVLSSMWVVLLHCSAAILIIIKVRQEKCQKFIPRIVMSIKNNFTITLTLTDTLGCRTGRLLSSIGLKVF